MLATTGVGFEAICDGIASLLWPIFALIVALVYKNEIKNALLRVRRAKVFGQEFELDKSLDNLEESTDSFAQQVSAATESPGNEDVQAAPSFADRVVREVFTEAARSPRVGLMLLSAAIEQKMREILLRTGHASTLSSARSLRQLALSLEEAAALPKGVIDTVAKFAEVRNQIVHGHGTVSDADVLRAVDAGLTLYRTLASIPIEKYVVVDPHVDLYWDKELTLPVSEVHGVRVETTSSGGLIQTTRVFPTTRTHFLTGKELSWEWDTTHAWGRLFYADPDSSTARSDWSASAEFVGRHIDET